MHALRCRHQLIVKKMIHRTRAWHPTRVLHLPMQAIVRIEEVDRKGSLAIRDATDGQKVTPFPMPPRNR